MNQCKNEQGNEQFSKDRHDGRKSEEEQKRDPEQCPVGSSDGAFQPEEAKVSEEKQKGTHKR